MEIRFPKKKKENLIRSSLLRPGDIVRFEYGDYDNTVTVRIDAVSYPASLSQSRYSQELIWHYLSDEQKKPNLSGTAALSQAGQQSSGAYPYPYKQHTCYSNPNDLVEIIERNHK